MKHKWEEHRPPGMSNAELFMSEPRRKCANCGKVQELYREHSWGRIVRRTWVPLAGRCGK